MMPLPVGVSVAMMKRSKASSSIASRPHNSVVRRLPAVQTCSAISLSRITRSKSAIRHRGRPAIDMERDVRMHLQQMIAGDRARAGNR